jgi:hypothetical protein
VSCVAKICVETHPQRRPSMPSVLSSLRSAASDAGVLEDDTAGSGAARAAEASDSDDGSQGGLCVICLTNEAALAAVPCGHFCVCEADARALQRRQRLQVSCPVCRAPVQSFLRVYAA